jgi:hypothetical protein
LNVYIRYDTFETPFKTFLFLCFQLVHPCFCFCFYSERFLQLGMLRSNCIMNNFLTLRTTHHWGSRNRWKELWSRGKRIATILDLLQALASMWSFFGCIFFKGDTSSIWYELEARNVNKKTLDVRLLLRLGQTKVVLAQDVEWICCFTKGQKNSQA